MKTLINTDISGARKNVKDLVIYGNGDMFQLLCKASSVKEGWMKSTKAMEIPGIGCVVQVTTQQGDNVAEAVCFVPGVRIEDEDFGGRKLVAMEENLGYMNIKGLLPGIKKRLLARGYACKEEVIKIIATCLLENKQ